VFRTQALLERNDISIHPFSGPVKVIAAGQDRLRSDEEVAELARNFGSEIEVIDESGHLIPLEKPYQLAQAIFGWLQAVKL